MSDTIEHDAERLPLWKNVVDVMMEQGVSHGGVFQTSFFEEGLKAKRDSMAFNLGVSHIRRALEHQGKYLSTRGQRGEQYIVMPARANRSIMNQYARKAIDALKRGVILGTNTSLSLLNAEERRKHEATLEKLAIKSALFRHSGKIASIVKRTDSDLLK